MTGDVQQVRRLIEFVVTHVQAVLDCYTLDPTLQGIRRAPVKELTCSQNLLYSLCAGYCMVWRSGASSLYPALRASTALMISLEAC